MVVVVAMATFDGVVVIAGAAARRRVGMGVGGKGFSVAHGAIENPEVAV